MNVIKPFKNFSVVGSLTSSTSGRAGATARGKGRVRARARSK